MKTIQKEITVYTYNELSDEAKEKALQNNYESEYFWNDENRATLNEFEKVMPVNVHNWSYGDRGEGVQFDVADELENLMGVRLYKWIVNNIDAKYYNKDAKDGSCPLTGYGADCNILKELVAFMQHPSDIDAETLFGRCFDAWVTGCKEDMEDYYSEESFKEMCESNEWTFLESGEMYNV